MHLKQDVSRLLKGCLLGVGVFKCAQRVLQVCSNGASWTFHIFFRGCFKGVSSSFEGCFEKFSREVSGCFKEVTKEF